MSGTVDDFSEDGWYVDRRGWHWFRAEHQRGQWHHFEEWGEWHLTDAQMRLLIERDKHRDECVGLGSCPDHPVPIVCQNFNEDGATAWEVVGAHSGSGLIFDLPHAHAMNVARALAVSE